ncbi:glycosyl hydrolase family 8 [Streptomyces rugosispiralis]|uniref:Glycosyl hydrolase family 8 n=1 Tax=Streptomyces rugosispiralis TaxID=2967341 RepID=A0ABT1V0T3_9ACTN|nr:glycosyl hydrolase family 8 [Streptomyces rugosispiralis]MCQ8190912.1 glycosyl hydrolase family 8 [Streptomyces rugosispiralis]
MTGRAGARVPFGAHAVPYAPGTLRPTGDPAVADRRVLDHYGLWKASFLRSGDEAGGRGRCAVFTPDAAHPYVAEAQGYGLVITALMAGADPDAHALFDGILRHVLAHPSVNHPDLHAAQQDADGRDVGGRDSATDGDLDIAYGLLLADRQWGSGPGGPGGRGSGGHDEHDRYDHYDYEALAVRRIDAVMECEVHPTTRLTKLGDWSSGRFDEVSRTSDWMPDHFRAFRAATGDPRWDQVLDAQLSLAGALRARHAPATGLLPDFVVDTTSGEPGPAPGQVLESPHDGDYHWNACRVPWRFGADAVTSGDARTRAAARDLSRWARTATGGDPGRIRSGYRLDGTAYGDPGSPAFFAPFAVAALTEGEGHEAAGAAQRWLDALWARMCAAPPDPARAYAAGVGLQSMLVVSHNYWVP